MKSLGNGFFEAANKGAQEAAKELGGVEVIYTGPTTTTAEGQIEVINSLIAQGVDAIAISANDPDAVVPALKKATQRGIKVISWDSGVAPDGRILQLNPSSNELIGKMCLTLAKDHLDGGKGDFAILSATTTSTNQNIWIDEMKKQLKDFPGLNLVTTVYGDDLSDKSYREAEGLLKSQPERQGHRRSDDGRRSRRFAGRQGHGPDRPGLRDRSRPAVRNGRRDQVGRDEGIRDLEPDRPRLFGNADRLSPRQG